MKTPILILFLTLSTIVSAQRFTILNGKLKNLKGISEFNITFNYDNLKVHGFDSEEAYLKDKMDKREKTEGEAEKFKKDWYDDRTAKYEPKFIESFNKRFNNGEIKVGVNPNSKYTMHIKTIWIYPGYNVVATSEPAKISAIVTVYETANKSVILLSLQFDKSIGLEHGQFDFDQGYRIAGAYEKLAKNLTIQLKRFL